MTSRGIRHKFRRAKVRLFLILFDIYGIMWYNVNEELQKEGVFLWIASRFLLR